jgi:hypothetical protein
VITDNDNKVGLGDIKARTLESQNSGSKSKESINNIQTLDIDDKPFSRNL